MSAQRAIRRYKTTHSLTWVVVSDRLGISHNYARKLGCGQSKRISPELARKIEERTQGEIRAIDLVF